MIRWTTKGAVATPSTVQIRAQQPHAGRVQAGAPAPSRSLTESELRSNILYFTAGMRGPRTAACSGLVLTGAGLLARPDLPGALALGRQEGLLRVVLHTDAADLLGAPADGLQGIDSLALTVQPDDALSGALDALADHPARGRLQLNLVLSAEALPQLEGASRRLAALGPAGLGFTFPFHHAGIDDARVPSPQAALRALMPALAHVGSIGLPCWVKGLPACFLGPHAQRMRRTQNRWYVDADHQGGAALLFLPDLLAFHKDDGCRFCVADDRCDGFFAAWLARPGWPALRPFDDWPDDADADQGA
jgi:hypothetical protein